VLLAGASVGKLRTLAVLMVMGCSAAPARHVVVELVPGRGCRASCQSHLRPGEQLLDCQSVDIDSQIQERLRLPQREGLVCAIR
jgi:hypothetical protein